MHNNKKQVIWVDGPTGVGKDTFIDRLTDGHDDKTIVISATDSVLVNSEDNKRKYVQYNTKDSEISDIVSLHLELITYINSLLTEYNRVILNRSFSSCLIYNLRGMKDEEKRTIIEEYGRTLSTINGANIMFNLLPPGGNHKILLDRIKSRGSNDGVEEIWFEYLADAYNYVHMELSHIYDEWNDISSGESMGVLSLLSVID